MSFYSEGLNYAKIQERAKEIGNVDLSCSTIENDPELAATTAVAIFQNPNITYDDLVTAATHRKQQVRGKNIIGFVPIYLTNHCDGECKMCGMRHNNNDLVRQFSTKSIIDQQLRYLFKEQDMRGVAFLTGEFNDDYVRKANSFIVGYSLNEALKMGFERVYINIGSLQQEHMEIIADFIGKENRSRVAMCVNQETYNEHAYNRYMAAEGGVAFKADFKRRLESHDLWLSMGFSANQIGSLLGLNPDLGEEVAGLCSHAKYLMNHGAKTVFFALPRLNPALGASNRKIVNDQTFKRIIATLAYVAPECAVMMTTRETMDIQDEVLPMIGCLAPGTPVVGAYGRGSRMPNDKKFSQFQIEDTRLPKTSFDRVQRETDYTIIDYMPKRKADVVGM